MPSDIDPQSGFRLPLPKREDMDEAGRRVLDRASAPGAVTAAFIDEIPQAYKPIDTVMADAADLVRIRHTLRQLVNVKGD